MTKGSLYKVLLNHSAKGKAMVRPFSTLPSRHSTDRRPTEPWLPFILQRLDDKLRWTPVLS